MRSRGGWALVALGVAFSSLPFVGPTLLARFGLYGTGATEILCVLLPTAIGITLVGTGRWLGRPTPRSLLWSAVAGAAAFYLVAAGLEVIVASWFPMPAALREQLRSLVVPPHPRPLMLDLFFLAVVPAVCEELLFRGLLLFSLLRHTAVSPRGALFFTSVAFGAFHFSPYKWLPTASLGVVLGVIALRAGSVWPAVVAHALNNAWVVLLLRVGFDAPPGVGTRWGAAGLVAAACALGGALAGIRESHAD